jgi:dTDP-4-dehydrorhamnose 3,5-epimerase
MNGGGNHSKKKINSTLIHNMVHKFTPNKQNQISEFVYKMPIEGLLFIKHKLFSDDRGFYAELSRIPELDDVLGTPFTVKQMNLSHSFKNVIRGFHAEDWNKLLTVTQGVVFAAWADIRTNSETFGEVVTMEVGKDNGTPWGSVYVAKGIANSFCTLTDKADYLYAVDQLYADRDTSHDVAISLFDKDLGVEWPLSPNQMIISDRDRSSVTVREKFPEKFS